MRELTRPTAAHTLERAPWLPTNSVGDLFQLHEAAGIQLRVLADLGQFWQQVITSTVGFSGIRLRNAKTAVARPYTHQ
jgi:hypothetical protein